MVRRKGFLDALWSTRWDRSYERLSDDRKKATEKVVFALVKQEVTPGMRVKRIQPDGYYSEARINDGDRLIFRIEAGTVWFVDVVPRDGIARYGKRFDGLF